MLSLLSTTPLSPHPPPIQPSLYLACRQIKEQEALLTEKHHELESKVKSDEQVILASCHFICWGSPDPSVQSDR